MPRTLRELALDEMRHPVGAYDKIEKDGSHPLAWLLKESDAMPNPRRLNGGNLAGEVRRRFGDEEGDPAEMDADTLSEFVRLCIAGLSGDERGKFLSSLSAILEMETGPGADIPSDSRPRPAQDRAIAPRGVKPFADRYPYMANIKVGGSWFR
jgi:hypothetical protein